MVQFVDKDPADPAVPAILLAYGLVSALLVASTVLVFDGIRQVVLRRARAKKKRVEEKSLPFHLLIGGFIVPVVLASLAINVPLVLLELIGGMPTQQAILYWSPISPYLGVDVAYSATYFLIVVGACFFTMYENLDPKDMAKDAHKEGYTIPGVAPGAATARYLSRITASVTVIGGAWMAAVVVFVPVVFEALLGPSRPRLPLGGGPFVVTAAILINSGKKLRPQLTT